MKVNNISVMTFQSKNDTVKKIIMSESAKNNAQKLLEMMNNKTIYVENEAGTGWRAEILASLSMGDKIKFTDNRMFVRPVKKIDKDTKYADCSIAIGKNRLDINSQTGEIMGYEKGFFTALKSLIAKAEIYISDILSNFSDKTIVKQNTFPIAGFTQKGYERFKKYM